MSLLAFSAPKVSADTSPVAPSSIPSNDSAQNPNAFEALRTLSDVGELGYLFDHNPMEWAPAPLESGSSPASSIDADSQTIAMVGPTLEATSTPQPAPSYATVAPATTPTGAWSFTDTLKKEVSAFQGKVNQLFSPSGGYNDGGN
jgi:hypothetical protein